MKVEGYHMEHVHLMKAVGSLTKALCWWIIDWLRCWNAYSKIKGTHTAMKSGWLLLKMYLKVRAKSRGLSLKAFNQSSITHGQEKS